MKCKGRTKSGAPCQAFAGPGGFCYFHANPDSAKKLGRKGGQKNRKSAVDLDVPDNLTATGLCKMNIEVMRLLLSGDLRAREVCAFVHLSNSLSRILPTADLEARLAVLEDKIAQNGTLPRREVKQPPVTDLADPFADGAELVEVDSAQSIVEDLAKARSQCS